MKKLVSEKHKETCFVPEADCEEEIVVLRKPEIFGRSLTRNLMFVWVNPKPLPEAEIQAYHEAKIELFHAMTALILKEYFAQSTDSFVVMVKPNHYPSIKGLFKDDQRIQKVILLGPGKIPKQENKIVVADSIEETIEFVKSIKK